MFTLLIECDFHLTRRGPRGIRGRLLAAVVRAKKRVNTPIPPHVGLGISCYGLAPSADKLPGARVTLMTVDYNHLQEVITGYTQCSCDVSDYASVRRIFTDLQESGWRLTVDACAELHNKLKLPLEQP